MEDKPDEQKPAGLNRRRFIGALGAAAAAGAFLERGGGDAKGSSSTPVMYLDSYGNVVPASPAALAAGTLPPPVPSSGTPDTGTTAVATGYYQPNILMIMVDQMRAPRWVPSTWTTSGFATYLPNIYALQSQAYVFPNFFAAATACTPCRATVQTGLYPQQTCMLQTLSYGGAQPTLVPYDKATNTGYPTSGNVLSQNLSGGTPYATVWIGKWHLSANNPGGTGGPTAYGYNDTEYCIPNTSTNPYNSPSIAYPSPDGSANEGAEGSLLTGSVPPSGQNFPLGHTWNAPADQLEDGAIADAFVNIWLPHAVNDFAPAPRTPWFAGVSFVNPHDMSHFPYAYGLTITDPTDFGTPTNPPTSGYLIPPTTGYDLADKTSDEYIPALPNYYTAVPTGPLPGGTTAWNNSDNPATQPYGTYSATQGGYGKPTEQWYFQHETDNTFGAVNDQPGWLKFLNYYLWMQYCVDAQVGRVVKAIQNSPQFGQNTVILFLSDHGDYGGSHYMHRKGGGLYDEVINVPLYIKYPAQAAQKVLPYLCSTVDILPFLYFLVLGNESWRRNTGDLVHYLAGRESIADFIFSATPTQYRQTEIPNYSGGGYQPFIMHTCDEDLIAYIPNTTTQAPSHAIGFRTVDYTVPANTPYGGGKLGTYSYWPSPCAASPSPSQTQPLTTGTPATPAQEFEFYNYSPGETLSQNPQETGNQAFSAFSSGTGTWEAEANQYNNNFLSRHFDNVPLWPR